MEPEKSKLPAPPYVPFKTLMNFLSRFPVEVPGRIDTGLMAGMSGGMRGQLATSMRALGLIDEKNHPTDDMKALCKAEGEDRASILKKIITQTYPYLFSGSVNFGTMTGSMLREILARDTTATGETVARCIAFLREAAMAAGIPVSPFLKTERARVGKVKGVTKRPRKNEPVEEQDEEDREIVAYELEAEKIPAQKSLLLWGLFKRLPKPGTTWQMRDREQWLQTLQNVLGLEYPTD